MKKCTRWMLPGLLLVFGLIVEAKSTYAGAGSPDPTFGKGGVTITTLHFGFYRRVRSQIAERWQDPGLSSGGR